jgi:peptidoglycan hydrolase-like protein with peptidoglycan-binding domain
VPSRVRALLIAALLLTASLPAAPAMATTGMPLVASPSVTLAGAQAFARSKGAHARFVDEIVPALFAASSAQASANGGRAIDPAILVAQSAHETGWGRFGGVVPPTHHNTAGIKTAAGGANTDPDAHERFADWADGARAHTNHLAAYTGLAPVGTPHGRYHTVRRLSWAGSVRTVEELGARWAPSSTYGDRVAALTAELRRFAGPPPVDPPIDPPTEPPLEPAPLSPEGPSGMPTLRRGDRGAEVLALQLLLAERDPSFDVSSGPGVFGPRTERQVRSLQRAAGLPRSGGADRCVWEALWPTPTVPSERPPVESAPPTLRRGDCGADVALLNALLAARSPGFDPGPVPAVYGRATVAEVKRLQRSLRVRRSGRADATVWSALLSGD